MIKLNTMGTKFFFHSYADFQNVTLETLKQSFWQFCFYKVPSFNAKTATDSKNLPGMKELYINRKIQCGWCREDNEETLDVLKITLITISLNGSPFTSKFVNLIVLSTWHRNFHCLIYHLKLDVHIIVTFCYSTLLKKGMKLAQF